MKTLLSQRLFLTAPPSRLRRQRRGAFSLVEVTLALGIVTFGLVSVVGVLPTALASGRQSFDQNRAAAIANTLFASFRSQPFNKECYVDAQFNDDGTTRSGQGPAPIDFNLPTPITGNSAAFYAKFLGLATDTVNQATGSSDPKPDNFGTQRRLAFSVSQPPGGADYAVALNFYDQTIQNGTTVPASNEPDGMVTTGQACRVEIVIHAVSRPTDQYRFVSTVANRSN